MTAYRTWVPLPLNERDRESVIESARGLGWPVERHGQLVTRGGRFWFQIETAAGDYDLATIIHELQQEIAWAFGGTPDIPRPRRVR